jgi:hypothetical protein
MFCSLISYVKILLEPVMLLEFIKSAVFSFYFAAQIKGTMLFYVVFFFGWRVWGLEVMRRLCFCFAVNQFFIGWHLENVFSPEGTKVGRVSHNSRPLGSF